MKRFKIAVIQFQSRCGKQFYNLERASRLIEKAARQGAKIIGLPELFDTGYDLPWVKKHVNRTSKITKAMMASLAFEYKVYISAVIANVKNGRMFNSAFFFSPSDGLVARYDKNYLFRGSPQQEHKYFSDGKGVSVVNTPYGKIGLAICNDLRYPSLFSRQALMGAKIIFVGSAWSRKRLIHWKALHRARAIENQVYIASANQVGKTRDVVLAGHSMIVDFDGDVIVEKKGGEGVVVAEIDYDKLDKKRRELPTFMALKKSEGCKWQR